MNGRNKRRCLDQEKSYFFNLPLEVREVIYRLLCSHFSIAIPEGECSSEGYGQERWIQLLSYSHPSRETYELQKWDTVLHYSIRYWPRDLGPITCETRPCIAGWLASCRKA